MGLGLGHLFFSASAAALRADRAVRLCNELVGWIDEAQDDDGPVARTSWLILRRCATASLLFDMRRLGREQVVASARRVDVAVRTVVQALVKTTIVPQERTPKFADRRGLVGADCVT